MSTVLRVPLHEDQKQLLRSMGDMSKITRQALKEYCEKRGIEWPDYLFIQKVGTVPAFDPDYPKRGTS